MHVPTLLARTAPATLLVLSLAVASTAAADQERSPHIGVQAGLLGLGITGGLDISDRFAVRAQFNRFEYGYDSAEAGNDYSGDLMLSSTALMADWHPGGPFRLTAGVVFNGNELAVEASSRTLDLGARRYDADLRVQMAFDSMAPYAGIGWSGRRSQRGLAANVDLGVLFQGAPEVTAAGEARDVDLGTCRLAIAADSSTTLSGPACPATAFAALRDDAMREHGELADALEDFKLYPVASLGLVYRF